MFILAFRQISCLFGISSVVLFCPPTSSSDKIELTSDRPNRHDICLKAKINYNIILKSCLVLRLPFHTRVIYMKPKCLDTEIGNVAILFDKLYKAAGNF